jgi:lipopolysaccharide export system protein LptA
LKRISPPYTLEIWNLNNLLLVLCSVLVAGAGVFTTSADRAVSRDTDTGEMVIDLFENVVVTDGAVTVTSDSGTVWQESGNAVFYSNVTVEADSLAGSSHFLEYLKEAGMITMTGSVVLTDGETVLEAGEVVYFRESRKATARENVIMTGPDIGRVEGQYALYDRERGSLFVTVDPILRRVEDGDSLIVIADRLEFFPEDNSAEAQGNASISMPDMDFYSTSEYLRYFGNEDRFELFGSPVLESEDSELSGDWMEILLEPSGDPRSVRIEGGASGHFLDTGVDPPAETWFSSERAFFAFNNDDPDSVMLTGSATLRMKSGGEAASRNEMNTVRGNTLLINFENGEAVEVIVSGHVTGTYSYLGGNP